MPDSPLTCRPAGLADVAAIVALVESAYRGESSRAGWTTEADLLGGQRTDPEQVRTLIDSRDSTVLLAERAGAILGCLLARREDASTAYLGMFAVRPSLQGQGVGRALLDEAERFVREAWGASAVRGTVIAQRPELIAYYERRGFQRTGATEPFPYGDARFGEPVRDDLYFLELRKVLAP